MNLGAVVRGVVLACVGLLAGGGATALAAARSTVPEVELLVEGLVSPWGMAFLPDGRLLVTERAGQLRVLSADGTRLSPPVAGLPCVDHRGHGGLLDVAVDPRFASNRLIYFSYTEAASCDDHSANGLSVARARLSRDGSRIDGLQLLFRQLPRVVSAENLGGRLALSRGGYLFITVGDRLLNDERPKAQDLSSYQGKTLRLRSDGSVPADNPFVGVADALPAIWTLGHRNPQGAFVHPRSGLLWVAEHGPFGGDEINIARKGRNYGWPLISHGCEYNSCKQIGDIDEHPGMEPPLAWWGRPGIAPSNLMLYSGDRLPQWRGHVFVGTLANRALWHLQTSDAGGAVQLLHREALFAQLGMRIRDVKQGPDGLIYLLGDGSNARIVRIGGAAREVAPF
ncbi:MAG: PQQ-dependent sugar dehydrogenase [Rubrivivax sp.]